MYYYLFINNYEKSIHNIILLQEKYNLIQTKNVIIFLFNNFKFEKLKSNNEVTIIMTLKELEGYHSRLINDDNIVNFVKDSNSLELIEKSLFGLKYTDNKFVKKYNLLLEFMDYLKSNKYNNIIFVSGITYLLYGLRINSDIDIITRHKYPIRFSKTDVDIKYIKEYDDFKYLFEEPSLTFYFKGFRISTLRTDIFMIRKLRARHENFKHPKAVADIIMVKKLVDDTTEIPIDLKSLNQNKKEKVLRAIKWRYNSEYNPFVDNI